MRTTVNRIKKITENSTALVMAVVLPLLGATQAIASDTSSLVIVADSRALSGWEAWFTNLYNESHLLFTALTVVLIPLIGLIFGLLADFLMTKIGLDLTTRELAEQ